jgi:hypothetical protein
MFESSKAEVLRNCSDEVRKEQIKRLEQLIGKRSIASTILWLKSLRKQAEAKNSHSFVQTCTHEIENLSLTYNQYEELQRELEVARGRAMDLEGKLIVQLQVNEQLRRVVRNYEAEFGK